MATDLKKNGSSGQVAGRVLDAFFPPRCVMCDKIIPSGLKHICKECSGKIHYVEEPTCYKCGKHILSDEEEFCYDCSRYERSFIKGYALFEYKSPVSDSMMALKYHGRQEYAEFYGDELYKKYGKEFKKLDIDAIVPVPIFQKKYATRGYNQAELIAKVLGIRLRKKVNRNLIMRVQDTPPQKELSQEERDKNMKKAFEACKNTRSRVLSRSGMVVPECILLVDDIYTTGSTIEACTKAAFEAGVKRVYAAYPCIGSSD